jgi:hypothetical protein
VKRLIRKRPSGPMILAFISLFVALGGVGYAAATVGSGQIKNNSIRGKDIRNGTIVSKDINKKTRKALKGQEGSTGATGATGADGAPATRLWAVILNPAGVGNATLARGSGVVSVNETTGVSVRFNRDVSGCAWIAGRNAVAGTVEAAGYAQASLDAAADTLDVRARDPNGTINTGGNLHVAVFC